MSIKKEQLNNFVNKKIALLGLGIENLAFLKLLINKRIDCEITICDKRSKDELNERLKLPKKNKIKLSLGDEYDKDLKQYDIIMRSPGYPLFSKELIKAKRAGVKIDSPMKEFFDLCPAKIIGVTGSKGKGTTSSLIYSILKLAFKNPDENKTIRKIYLGGNIGVAPFDFVNKLNKTDFVILELSSFQLEDMDKSPNIAVITNLYKEHLAPADVNNPNYHKSFAKYWQAKKNIYKHQTRHCYLIANDKLKNKIGQGRRNIFFTKLSLESKLIGEHNKENIAAAYTVARMLKIKKDIIEKAVKRFRGLPHRIEKIAEINEVKYYDDSFATVPEASIIALKSFDAPIILLAGGADKGADFKNLVKEIKKKVKYLILFNGKGSDKIIAEIEKRGFKIKFSVVDSMSEAINIAKAKAEQGDIVLLSTGCASFGVFKNYKERGKLFKEEAKR